MSDSMECPESPEDILKKLIQMEHEHVRVNKNNSDEFVKGRLTKTEDERWEVQGPNGSCAKFKPKHIESICHHLVKITLKSKTEP